MGDADVVGAMDTGDAAASRALQMEGGSLPPRKRLLAGLKLNGLLSTSPPPAVSPTVESGARKYDEGCMGCNVADSNGLRRIKRGGVSLRLCSACTLLYSKNMFCPHCLAMYHDASLLGDLSMWLVCTRCKRSVHPECEQKQSGSKPDAASYVCPDCVKRQREANGVTGMRSKSGSGRPNESSADFVNPALKKPRMHRERRDHHGDGSRFERHSSAKATTTTLGPPRKMPSPLGSTAAASSQEAAVAAKNAAIAATKVAVAAKANAAAKAGAAVKAAATAKTALEAAALAAKAEAACRAELRRKTGNSDTRLSGPRRLEINVHSEPRRDRGASMKHERDDGYAGRRPSVDDEELARQLHRVINSSPRISRSMTPMRRKNPSVKPETPSSGVSNSSAETVRARPRTNPSPVEPEAKAPHEHQQFRHQQTRPRSITHKEFRRLDSRVSRHADKGIDQDEAVGSDQPAPKSETMDGAMDDASILFDALVDADGEAAAAAGAGRRPDYLQEILEAAVLTDAAMFNDSAHHDLEIVRPEPEAAEQGQEPEAAEQGQEPEAAEQGQEPEAAEQGQEPEAAEQGQEPEAAEQGQEPEATEQGQEPGLHSLAANEDSMMPGEVTVAMAGDPVMIATNDAVVEITGAPLEQEEEKAAADVVHDVVMQEEGGVGAAASLNVTSLEFPSTSGVRVEEAEEGARETTVGADASASTPSVTPAAVVPLEADVSESELQAVAAPQQSG